MPSLLLVNREVELLRDDGLNILVGITNKDLTSLRHRNVTLKSVGPFKVLALPGSTFGPLGRQSEELDGRLITKDISTLVVKSAGNTLVLEPTGTPLKQSECISIISQSNASISLEGRSAHYIGRLFLWPDGDWVRVVLETPLDSYLSGVLESEMPASYHEEALKAQAITARTYALHPRIDHQKDGCNVCDSYLCCQFFAGLKTINARHKLAIEATANQILVYQGKPILALFSSCAGGHTENYENCFCDPVTNLFPPAALPYLKGVPEGALPQGFNGDEASLQKLWQEQKPKTADAWSAHFKWSVSMPASALEAHMHHVIKELQADPEMAPFIVPPAQALFGQIKAMSVTRRGVAGTAIELTVSTTRGDWAVRKELVIRSLFKNPELKLARLKSGRILLDQERDQLGALSFLTVRGFGWGHGVGLQQTGAQGWAVQGKKHQEILAHYFSGATISRS